MSALKISPYLAPELLDTDFNPIEYSDSRSKADMFSLGVIYKQVKIDDIPQNDAIFPRRRFFVVLKIK